MWFATWDKMETSDIKSYLFPLDSWHHNYVRGAFPLPFIHLNMFSFRWLLNLRFHLVGCNEKVCIGDQLHKSMSKTLIEGLLGFKLKTHICGVTK